MTLTTARDHLLAANEFPPLPSDWAVERFRFLFRESKERNGAQPIGDMLSVSEYRGVVPRDYDNEEQRRTDEELETYRVVRPKQLAVNTMWLNHLGLGVSEHLGHVSPAYAVYAISSRLEPRYVHHLLRSQFYLKIYLRYLYGIRPNSFQIKANDWNSIPIIVPPIETQKAIADFLDRETARIDQLIEKKQRLVELLGERIKNLADMVASKVENAPLVPMRRVLKRIEQGWSPDCEARLAETGEWGVLKVGCVNGWSFQPNEHKALPSGLSPRAELEIRDGDILMSRANSRELVGSVAMVTDAPPRLLLCDKLYRLHFDDKKIDPRFAVVTLRSDKARRHYERCSNGASASMQNIGQEVVRTLLISLPSLHEQARLVAEFADASEKATVAANAVARSLSRIQEFRTALIAAAVTGQIDVAAHEKRGRTQAHLDDIDARPRRKGARA